MPLTDFEHKAYRFLERVIRFGERYQDDRETNEQPLQGLKVPNKAVGYIRFSDMSLRTAITVACLEIVSMISKDDGLKKDLNHPFDALDAMGGRVADTKENSGVTETTNAGLHHRLDSVNGSKEERRAAYYLDQFGRGNALTSFLLDVHSGIEGHTTEELAIIATFIVGEA